MLNALEAPSVSAVAWSNWSHYFDHEAQNAAVISSCGTKYPRTQLLYRRYLSPTAYRNGSSTLGFRQPHQGKLILG